MSIIVYYLEDDGSPRAPRYEDHDWSKAMAEVTRLRNAGRQHVTMSNEPSNMVGKPGVASVEDGKTPDGEKYEWSKAHRAGRVRDPDRPIYNDGELVK